MMLNRPSSGSTMTELETLGALAALAQDQSQCVPSPCLSVCRMQADNSLCLGCFRTMDEIIAWGRMEEPDKRLVWRRITERAGLEPMPGAGTPYSRISSC